MINRKIIPIIIAGGVGSRLWPISRNSKPKQFVPLVDTSKSLFQQTLQRVSSDIYDAPVIICNDDHRFLAAEQLRTLGVKHNGLILEPMGKNTAPAICLAALRVKEIAPNSLMLVLPADHFIDNEADFTQTISRAVQHIEDNQLLTFGIKPDRPATGYGYIKVTDQSSTIKKVKQFVEKPDLETAKQYLETGEYYWNSGMFLFTAESYLRELAQYQTQILTYCEKAWASKKEDLEFIRINTEYFEQCNADSIDYAIMEHTHQACMCHLESDWSDVGDWSSLAEVLPKKESDNVEIGDVVNIDSTNNLIHAESRLVTTLGLHDHVVIETLDAVMVIAKSETHRLKELVNVLKKQNRDIVDQHKVIYRPWGSFLSMDVDEGFQVKRLTVKPKAKLSLQRHQHRSEHWVVVKGVAKVRVGDEEKLLKTNESIYIPKKTIHSLENPFDEMLEIIEVQTGSYLGEDDIERFEDIYGRAEP